MSTSDKVKIIWKTNCLWRDTDYVVERKDIKPIGINHDRKKCPMLPLKIGDAVKVKYGSRWYKAEVAEFGDGEIGQEVPETDVPFPSLPETVDHYKQFLAQQAEREKDWKEESKYVQKVLPKRKEKQQDDASKSDDTLSKNICNEQLRRETLECEALKERVSDLEKNSVLAGNLTNMINEMHSSITETLSRIEQRLESMESRPSLPFNSTFQNVSDVYEVEVEETSRHSTSSENVLSTIDLEALKRLCENPSSNPVHQTHIPEEKTKETNPASGQALSEDLIKTFVTPRKDVKKIRAAMDREKVPHRCALKLLPYFFTNDDLQKSNTDGTHGKLPLDRAKLNSLKVLLFSRFPTKSVEEEEKVWKYVKTKINTKCRVNKFPEQNHKPHNYQK